jgi:NAD(P)-dependent dehydrogenase (short-subunit alcohol dehydrogenase family)
VLDLLVTGANSDIGSAVVVHAAAAADSNVLITTRKTACPALEQPFQARVTHLRGIDLTSEGDTHKVAEAAAKLFSAPFCWLHCAGDFWAHRTIEQTELEDAKRMFSSHFVSLYATAKAIIPVMKRVGGGRLVAFSCNSVRHNYPDMAAFTPAKAAVESFVRCLANECLEYGILANCLALPTIATDKVIASKPEEYHPFYATASQLVDAVVECFSGMSPLVTGNSIGIVKYSPYYYREGYYHRNRSKPGT